MALLLGFFLAIVSSELALRGYAASRGWTSNCYVTGLIFFVPHASAGYTLRPNLRLKSSTYDVTTNSTGCRGPEISQRSPARKRILVLGGSSVFGYLVPDGADSCAELQRILDQASPGGYEVINAGVPGYNMVQCRERYKTDLTALQPDYVLLYLGWNDSKFVVSEAPTQLEQTPPAPELWERVLARSTLYGLLRYRLFPPAAPQFSIPGEKSVSVTKAGADRFEDEMNGLLDVVAASKASPIISTQLMAAHFDDSDPNGRALAEYLGGDERQVAANRAVGTWITDKLREVAMNRNVQLVDTASMVPSSTQTLGDAIHLTELGHRQVAEVWATAILAEAIEDQ